MKEQISHFEPTPSLPELSDDVIEYAERSRIAPREWLKKAAEHLQNGDITEEDLHWCVQHWGIASKDVFKRMISDFPKATNLFTYMDAETAFWSLSTLNFHWLKRTWPAHLSLAGIEVDANQTYGTFEKIDMTGAAIPYVTTHGGERISLMDNHLDQSPVQWELGKNKVGMCYDAEQYFQQIFERRSAHDRAEPFDGVLLTDRGHAVACLKFDGVHSLVALRTVTDTEGKTQFHKGMLYALGSALYKEILKATTQATHDADVRDDIEYAFLTIDVADLKAYCAAHEIAFEKNNMRFLGETPVELTDQSDDTLYELMTLFAQKAENGELRTFPLFGPLSPPSL